jgi:hypothetical protein
MELYPVYATASLIVGLGLVLLVARRFDPFAPVWLFLVGYAQVYVVQAISYHEYAVRVRGVDLVASANTRALWALAWFLAVYFSGLGRVIAARLPRPPGAWSPALITGITPPMVLWGLVCAGIVIGSGVEEPEVSAEENLLRQFPIFMLVAGILLVVTGRQPDRPRPLMSLVGLLIAASYVLIWMFNGKRSHSLIAVLTAVCAYYVPRGKRPGLPVLVVTAVTGATVVSLALGWRGNFAYERSFAGFFEYVGDFDPSAVLVNLNLRDRHQKDDPDAMAKASYETEEYGGFLLMMDTVPAKAGYDYGAPYIRIASTYIPRILWRDKPYFGREAWVAAWIAGSEFARDTNFTGPAIGVLGATQLNGGATATVIVLAILALLLRTGYDYFRLHAHVPWVQAWWSVSYYVAWLMTVNDDPFVWFYYLYGHTTLAPMALLWVCHRVLGRSPPAPEGFA